MDDSILILLICFISISVSISIGVIIYFMNDKGTYGTYVDKSNKTQPINSLPIEFTAKSINAVFPGCIPKANYRPANKAPINCSKGMFTISGQQNGSDGGFTTFDNMIAGRFLAISPANADFSVKLNKATEEEYKEAQKLITGK